MNTEDDIPPRSALAALLTGGYALKRKTEYGKILQISKRLVYLY